MYFFSLFLLFRYSTPYFFISLGVYFVRSIFLQCGRSFFSLLCLHVVYLEVFLSCSSGGSVVP